MKTLNDLFGARPSGPLYHYTSLEGLRGILETGTLWATHIRSLSDRSEYVHAIEFAKRHLSLQLEGASDTRRAFLNTALRLMPAADETPPVYVSSFCEQPDALTLWRGYCPAFDGYSIGYDWNAPGTEHFVIAKCVYDDADKTVALQLVDDKLAGRDPVLTKVALERVGAKVDSTSRHHVLGSAYAYWIAWFAPTMKDAAFADEREWRVLHRPGEDFRPEYRKGDRTMVRFARLDLSRNGVFDVDEVVLGPRENAEEILQATREWIESLRAVDHRPRVRCRRVSTSCIPFRPV